ncbi:MAG TPA: hypothetical protein PLQ97_06930 [Myxococcota bacterium]|nr:hypothetical protein [Myxococcota bacterium]HQK51982.1 hypothetical protein [Myxococcota bacterium]
MTEEAWRRRVRQRVQGPLHQFHLTCPPGFEEEARSDAREQGLGEPQVVGTGTLVWSGRLEDGWRACLVLSLVNRVRVEVASGRAGAPEAVFRLALGVPWEAWLPREAPLRVQGTNRRSRLFGSGFLERVVWDAVDRRFRDLGWPGPRRWDAGPDAEDRDDPRRVPLGSTLLARLEENRLTLMLDLAGEPLHRRGLRIRVSEAPLRETLAQGLLRRAGWAPGQTLVEGFAGDAPFTAEAAAWDRGLPPGRGRAFAFQAWPSFRPAAFRHLRQERLARALPAARSRFVAIDRSPEAVEGAREHLERAGVAGDVALVTGDFLAWRPPPDLAPGLLCLNPPYGLRLGLPDPLEFFRRLGRTIRTGWAGWRVLVVCPSPAYREALDLPTALDFPLFHGGLSAQGVLADLRG